ncbi:EAL domain-containing protein [Anaeromicrobium sediminis]|uniref:GGDEF domain-containing protein n=1 Tax=Anaeromicrobium sediminis TaxID=1478221 RepID=A0A267MF91_9FIRM|nr:EAL domain-containing protein [Anaeromicrobium sediminis]PAB58127.1 hypothetical protein CCE28_16765 [Anaeromicrobium sediminis]
MENPKDEIKKNVVNKYKLIHIPVFIVFLVVFTVSIASFYISKNLLLEQMKQDGLNLVKQITRQIEGNGAALDVMDQMFEDKIRTAGQIVIKNKENLDDEFLMELIEELNVDELHWMNENGETLYSTIEAYVGWVPHKGHPLYDFMLSKDKELMEDIRPDAEFGIPIKYGTIKNTHGNFVQVGILAENVQRLTERFSYQTLVEELGKEENITYITIVDKNLKATADSHKEDIGIVYDSHEEQEVKEALQGKVSMKEWYYEKMDTKVLELSAPLFSNGEIVGALVMGLSMERVYSSIYTIFITSSFISLIMFIIFLWVQNKNIIKPANQLDYKINQIDLDNNISYRMPVVENDPFLGLTISTNNLLDKIHGYFYELKEYQEELEASNEEIVAAYQQLTASDEELRAQYDEIQNYTGKLESLKQKYEIAIESTNSAVWEIDLKDRTIYLSQESKNIIGISFREKEKVNKVFNKILTIEAKQKLIEAFTEYKNGEKEEIYTQIQMKDKNGHLKWMLIRGKGVYCENKNLKIINGILLDITKLKEQEAYIEHLAYNDPLTNLPNRRSFFEKLEESINKRQSGAVILLDLDNFKEINDTLGHVYGDKVLKKVAQELIHIKDEKIFISRFGGDEFLLLIEGEDNLIQIENYVKKIINIFKDKQIIEGDKIYISCSMGITLYPLDSSKISQLLMNADMAMYKVKYAGKNNYMFFNKEMTEKLKEQIQIERILRDAIKEEGFNLLYQPQVCTYTGKIVGFEALLRIKNKRISPGLFIPIAEDNGMIIEIGRWVTKEAINQIRTWKKIGVPIKPIAINFSAKQLNDSNYIAFLKDQLKENNVEAKHIEIEITESIFLDKKEETIVFLNQLKNLGIKIALDDFGTGYSSLSYLTFLPVDKIKLDKSLCDKFLELEHISVMDNIISLAHSLKLEVLAEGIENIEQFKRLKLGGCNYVQGYLFSKPVEVMEVAKIYNDNFLEKIIKD